MRASDVGVDRTDASAIAASANYGVVTAGALTSGRRQKTASSSDVRFGALFRRLPCRKAEAEKRRMRDTCLGSEITGRGTGTGWDRVTGHAGRLPSKKTAMRLRQHNFLDRVPSPPPTQLLHTGCVGTAAWKVRAQPLSSPPEAASSLRSPARLLVRRICCVTDALCCFA